MESTKVIRLICLVLVISTLLVDQVQGGKKHKGNIVVSMGGKEKKEYVPVPVPVPVPVHVPVHVPHKKGHEKHGDEDGDEDDGEDTRMSGVFRTPPPTFYAHLAKLNHLTSNIPPFAIPESASNSMPYSRLPKVNPAPVNSIDSERSKKFLGGVGSSSSLLSAYDKSLIPSMSQQHQFSIGSPALGFQPYGNMAFGSSLAYSKFPQRAPAYPPRTRNPYARYNSFNPFAMGSSSFNHPMSNPFLGTEFAFGFSPIVHSEFRASGFNHRPKSASSGRKNTRNRGHDDNSNHHHNNDYRQNTRQYDEHVASHLSHMKQSPHIDEMPLDGKNGKEKSAIRTYDTRYPEYDYSQDGQKQAKYVEKLSYSDDIHSKANNKGDGSSLNDQSNRYYTDFSVAQSYESPKTAQNVYSSSSSTSTESYGSGVDAVPHPSRARSSTGVKYGNREATSSPSSSSHSTTPTAAAGADYYAKS